MKSRKRVNYQLHLKVLTSTTSNGTLQDRKAVRQMSNNPLQILRLKPLLIQEMHRQCHDLTCADTYIFCYKQWLIPTTYLAPSDEKRETMTLIFHWLSSTTPLKSKHPILQPDIINLSEWSTVLTRPVGTTVVCIFWNPWVVDLVNYVLVYIYYLYAAVGRISQLWGIEHTRTKSSNSNKIEQRSIASNKYLVRYQPRVATYLLLKYKELTTSLRLTFWLLSFL